MTLSPAFATDLSGLPPAYIATAHSTRYGRGRGLRSAARRGRGARRGAAIRRPGARVRQFRAAHPVVPQRRRRIASRAEEALD